LILPVQRLVLAVVVASIIVVRTIVGREVVV
jgi:hypothetical protein